MGDTMDKGQILDKISGIIVENLDVDREKVTADANYIDDLGADSLDYVELIMALEESFDISIPDEEAEKLTTVGITVDYVNEKVASK